MATTVFISYNHAQIKLARQFARDLYDLGCDPWLDERKMVVSDHLVGAMKRGIQESDAFLLLWSREAEASRMVKKEVEDAAHERATRDAYPVMIILLDTELAPSFHFDGLLYHSGKLTKDRATMPMHAYTNALSSVTAALRQRELIQGLHFIEDVAAQSKTIRDKPESWRALMNRAFSTTREYQFDGAGLLKEADRDVDIDIPESATGEITVMDSRAAALTCISENRILGLLGEPGIGKTSTLKRLACDLAGKNVGSTRKPIVPFYVSANEFEKSSDLEGVLSEKVGETRARFRSFLSSKTATVVLFLDDLQFISRSSQYSIHQQVLSFLRETEARLIVTFTDQSQTNLTNIAFATLNGLSPATILHALALLTNNGSQTMSRLRRVLWRPVIKELVGNPRWLAKFAKAYISRTVPSWWELIEKTVDNELWGTLDVRSDLRQLVRQELERLAFENTIEGARDDILVAELRQAVYDAVIDKKGLWDEGDWNAALMSLNDGQVIRIVEESVTFRLPAVYPALAAHFCINNDQESIAHSDSEIIEDVALHVLANPVADIIRAEWYKSLNQLDVRFPDRLLLLGRGLSAGNVRSSSIFAETVEALERLLVCTGSFNALDLLVDFGSAVALKACDNLLAASDERIRGFATMLLERSVGLTALLRKADYCPEGVRHESGTMDISSVRREWAPSLEGFPDFPVGQKAQELAAYLVQIRILSNGTRDRFVNGEAELALFRHLIIRAVGDEDLGDLALPVLEEGIKRLGLNEAFSRMYQIWFSQMLLYTRA